MCHRYAAKIGCFDDALIMDVLFEPDFNGVGKFENVNKLTV